MARKNKEQDLTVEEETSLEQFELPPAENNDGEKLDESVFSDLTDIEPSVVVTERPELGSPEWSEYVLSCFTSSEVDKDRNPNVAGLRRVTTLLLGDIVESSAKLVCGPQIWPRTHDNEVYGVHKFTPTIVEYTVVIETDDNRRIAFSDVADCYWGNADKKFCVFPSAMASTRAEARCLRKALQLNVVSAEELSTVEIKDDENGPINSTQIDFIEMMLERCDINGSAYLKSYKKKYSKLEDVSMGVAAIMCEHLGELFRTPERIPETVKGYQTNWRD